MTNNPQHSELEHLKTLVGPGGWASDPEILSAHLMEWRGLFTGATPLMLSPGSAAEAAAVLAYCSEKGIAVVPQGGNTGLAGGAIPGLDAARQEILLSARRLNKIHRIDTDNFTMTVGAGCILASLQQAAANVQCLFPLSLAAEGSCQIGGNLATNAGGTNVLRYGNARDLVLGLEVILPDGRIYDNLLGLRKDNTGYALDHLFIGAEGTLGFISAATLKIFPAPRSMATAWLAIESPEAALQLLAAARSQLGDDLVALELMPRIAVDMVLTHVPRHRDPLDNSYRWYVLLELASSREQAVTESQLNGFLAEQLEAGLLVDGAVAATEAQRNAFWSIRHDISLAQKSVGASIKHDISVPISVVPEFLHRADLMVKHVMPGIRPVAFGHLGDGNLHYNLSQPEDMDATAFLAMSSDFNERIHSLAVEMGGSFSAEHGIGMLKTGALERLSSPTKLSLMRDIKKTLDPANIMNPDKVLKIQQD